MSKSFKYKYKDRLFDSIEDFVTALNEDGIDVKMNDEATSDKQKFYDAKEFLNDANYYYNMTPSNLVQTASRLWLGSVYVVKDYFLDMGIYPVFHRSLKFLSDLAIGECASVTMAIDLTRGWNYAEQFHQYSYGSSSFNPRDFEVRKSKVEFFINNFSTIDKSAVKQEVMKFVNNPSEKIQIRCESNKTTLGKKEYYFDYKAF